MTMGLRLWHSNRTRSWSGIALAAVAATALLWLSAAWVRAATRSATVADPWTAANTVEPADLVHELASSTRTDKPVVVCTAPAFMYRSGHVPGASFHGPASTEQGLADLKSGRRAFRDRPILSSTAGVAHLITVQTSGLRSKRCERWDSRACAF